MTELTLPTEGRPPRSAAHRLRALLLSGDELFDAVDGQVCEDFAAWCAGHAGQACVLWVGSAHLSDLVCEPGMPLREPGARRDWALRVLQHYHGDAAARWALLPWQRRASWGVSALRAPSLQALQAQAAAHGVRLRAVRPLWPVLLDRLLAQQPGLRRAAQAQVWLVEAGPTGPMLSRITLVAGEIRSVHRRRLEQAWAAQLQQVLDESAPEDGAVLSLCCANVAADGPLPARLSPAPELSARDLLPRMGAGPDFLRPQARPGLLAWCWLAAAVLVLAVTAWDAWQAWRLSEQARQVALPVVPRRVEPVAAPVDRTRAVLRQRLNHPWAAVFLASEAPGAAGLRWVALDHQAGGELRLQGLAKDPTAVQQLAAQLRRQPAWQRVLVSRLETEPEGHGFEIVAQLAQGAP